MPTSDKLTTGATVAIMLADGFEEIETLTVAGVLYRADVRFDLTSVTDARHIANSYSVRIVADLMFEDMDPSAYTVLFLPGGMPGTLDLRGMPAIQAEVLHRSGAAQSIAAICAISSTPSELGVLDGRHTTANPTFARAIAEGGVIIHENPVVIDEQIIASCGAGTSLEPGLEIAYLLLGDDVVDEVARGAVLVR